MQKDSKRLSKQTSYRPSSFTEEDIQVKPSIELIADEYERDSNQNFSVHIFYANSEDDGENCTAFVETLESVGFKIDHNNLHDIQNVNYLETIEEIKEQCQGSDGLILLYTGFCKTENSLLFYQSGKELQISAKDIWLGFTSTNCPGLKDKPKIFLFQATKYGARLQHDGQQRISRMYTYEATYGAPAEADILIVYNKTDGIVSGGDPKEFLTQVCENIKTFGKSEDVVSLVTCTECCYYATRPLLISTLTRKFFFTINQTRGHHLYINEKQEELVKHLEELHETLKKQPDLEKETEKEKKRMFSFSFGKSFSGKDKDRNKKIDDRLKQNNLKTGRTVTASTSNELSHLQSRTNDHHVSSVQKKNNLVAKTAKNYSQVATKTNVTNTSSLNMPSRRHKTNTDHSFDSTSGGKNLGPAELGTSASTGGNQKQVIHRSGSTSQLQSRSRKDSTASLVIHKSRSTSKLQSSSRKTSTASLCSKCENRKFSSSEPGSCKGSLRSKNAEKDKKKPIPWRW